jgi:predicted metal-dependent phosphoesterase TrpH
MSQPALRCDLHVHCVHSGRVNLPLLRHFGNDSYSEPRAVYETARRRGMDLVTLDVAHRRPLGLARVFLV